MQWLLWTWTYRKEEKKYKKVTIALAGYLLGLSRHFGAELIV